MKGLLLKDWYMMKKYCRSYVLIAVVFIALSLVSSGNMFFVFYPCLLCGIIPVNLLGYDERSRWMQYSGTLPYTKRQIVSAKYLIGLLAQFLPWVLVPRGTYIYHYFASVPFLMLGTVMMMHHISKRAPKVGKWLIIGHLGLCLVWFILLFPYASGVMTPNGWMDFIRDYPYISLLPDYWKHDWLVNLNTFLEKIPIFPHVYHH